MNSLHPGVPRWATPKWDTRIKEAREAYERLDAYRNRVRKNNEEAKETKEDS